MTVRIIHGDSIVELRRIADAGERFQACVTDPPYGIGFMGKEWDSPGAFVERKPDRTVRFDKIGGNHNPTNSADAARTRRTEGAKYQAWCQIWARAVYEVLLPGAYLLAFGGTRTYHRLVCAIEDAGFECRDSVAWLYGAGFPKSLNVSKAIDKAAGAEREVIATGASVKRMIPGADQNTDGWAKDNGREFVPNISHPSTSEAAAWEGWGTALKPAMELICVARKPLSEKTVAANVLRHGTGALNIDASRVSTDEEPQERIGEQTADARYSDAGGTNFAAAPEARRGRPLREARRNEQSDLDRVAYGQGLAGSKAVGETTLGRWPANVCHDGSDEVLAAFPDVTGAASNGKRRGNGYGEGFGEMPQMPSFADNGNAARFFYTAKADSADRAGSKHPTVKPTDLMRWLVRLVTPPGGTVLDPFCGTGSTLVAADQQQFNAIGIERDATYVADARRKFERDAGLFADIAE